MRVLFIASHAIEYATSRLRIYQFLPFLERRGVECVVRPFLGTPDALKIYAPGHFGLKLALTGVATLRRFVDIVRAARFDVVYVTREAFPFGPPLIERALRAAAGRLIFDFDDAIWLPSSVFPNPLNRFRDWNKPAKLMQIADHIVVGSPLHLDYTKQHAAHPDRISVIPTVVDPAVYTPSSRPVSEDITVGWIGTPRNTGYLLDLLPAMRELCAVDRRIRFKFVGAEPFACGDLPVLFKTWQLDEEVSDIQSFDIGIMPLPDDEHARGKCGLKLIQYMSCGLPVICSPVGFNRELVGDEASGLFASSTKQWIAAITQLARSSELRARFGREGRRRIIEKYSSDVMAPRLLQVIEGTAARRAVRTAAATY